MSVAVRRSSSFSTQSAVGLERHILAGGIVHNGVGDLDFSASRGSYSSRVSNFSSFEVPNFELAPSANEKLTMQNLNHRLASYLDKVRSLQAANKKLELQIKEFYESRSPVYHKDLTKYYITIEDIQKQILARGKENTQLYLQVDNARLAMADFKMKCETEMNLRLAVEADIARLRATHEQMKIIIGDLKIQIPGLEEELAFLKKNHEEEMYLIRTQHGGSVNVEMDCAPSVDLEKELQEMREQYEALIQKNRSSAEQWFQAKAETLQSQVTSSRTEIKTSQTEISELKRTFQNLEIERDGLLIQKQLWDKNVVDVRSNYSAQLSKLQLRIDHLQEELQQLKASMQQQATEYQLLLDIKMRLELEIAEYRRLLEGDWERSVTSKTSTETLTETVTKTVEIVEEVEEHNPHVQRRVKVIVEELVDGKVVSTSVDEKIQDLN